MLSLLEFLLCATTAYSLTCHCLNDSPCHANGFCVEGCEKGWYGPGCQVGNVALHKPATQSTTYTDIGYEGSYAGSADLAVDGSVPRDASSYFCTYTDPNHQNAWWFVTLNTTHDYVITNITLVNRKGYYSYRLANFVILYSNETNSSDPNPTDGTWHEFARENGTVGANRTYTCNRTVIAKRVAVFLTAFPQNHEGILTLCEVKIYGYEHRVCPLGFTGPGCLLRACDQCVSTGGSCTGLFGSCSYDVCPDDWLLPPDCWITLSNFTGLSVQSTATYNSVLFSAVLPDSQPNIAATSLQLLITTSSDMRVLENATFSLRKSNAVHYTFSSASADTLYYASVQLQFCDSTGGSCFHTTGSKVFTIQTCKRDYNTFQTNGCIFISVSTGSSGCKLPSAIQITCESEANENITVNSSTSSVCGLEKDQGYNCSYEAIIDAHTIERRSAYIIIGRILTSPTPEKECSALKGIIGGLVAVIVVATIIAFVYYRRQRNAQSHTLAVLQDASASSHWPAGGVEETRKSSSNQEKCNNLYESLQTHSELQTEGDYANLKSAV